MAASAAKITEFGVLSRRPIHEAALGSEDGAMECAVIELGAAVRDLKVRRPDGQMQRVVLGLNTAEDYRDHSPHMGAIAGRFGNRIANGQFTLDGVTYQLPRNENGRTCLHGGGSTGFGKLPWTILKADAASVTMAFLSPAGDNGFPGAMTVTCRYSLAPPKTLRIELYAFTDAPTPVNLCHHSYFNLDGGADVLDHTLEVASHLFVPTDADLIPSGAVTSVVGTGLDFRKARSLRAVEGAAQKGIDNTFVLDRRRVEAGTDGQMKLAHAATLASSRSGLSMECWTTEPTLQVYDGYKLAMKVPGLDGAIYGPSAGIALEPQHVPNSPNLPLFPSTILRPGQLYQQVTEYRF